MKHKLIFLLPLFLLCCYSKREKLPVLNLLLIDSVTIFNTKNIPNGKPVLFMYFSPDCEHCQAETDSLLKNDSFLKQAICYFITIDPIERLRVFSTYYHISNYPNIVLAKDYQFAFYNFFKPASTPFFIVYDKHKELYAVLPNGGNIKLIHSILTKIK